MMQVALWEGTAVGESFRQGQRGGERDHAAHSSPTDDEDPLAPADSALVMENLATNHISTI